MQPSVVFCAGMRRSASRWQHLVAVELLGANCVDLGWVTWQQFDARFKEAAERLPGEARVVVKCHTYIPDFSRLCQDVLDNSVVLTSHRDLRDVMASMKLAWSGKTWTPTTWRREVDAVVKEFSKWERLASVTASYDGIVEEPIRYIRSIALALGVYYESFDAEAIAEKYSLENVKLMPRDNATNKMPFSDGKSKWREVLEDWQVNIIMQRHSGWLREWGYEV